MIFRIRIAGVCLQLIAKVQHRFWNFAFVQQDQPQPIVRPGDPRFEFKGALELR